MLNKLGGQPGSYDKKSAYLPLMTAENITAYVLRPDDLHAACSSLTNNGLQVAVSFRQNVRRRHLWHCPRSRGGWAEGRSQDYPQEECEG